MDRRISALKSPNPDINSNRAWQLEWIEKHKLPYYKTTKADVKWFWEDLDIEDDSATVREFVDQNLKPLCDRYAFLLTEFFEEFYRYMPECLWNRWDNVGQLDWDLFFTLAYPLPALPCSSFRTLIKKLNLAQLRIVKVQIMNEIWDSPEYRRRVLHEEVLPALYTQYIPYETIRREMVRRFEKKTRLMEVEKRITQGGALPTWMKEAQKLVDSGATVLEAYEVLTQKAEATP